MHSINIGACNIRNNWSTLHGRYEDPPDKAEQLSKYDRLSKALAQKIGAVVQGRFHVGISHTQTIHYSRHRKPKPYDQYAQIRIDMPETLWLARSSGLFIFISDIYTAIDEDCSPLEFKYQDGNLYIPIAEKVNGRRG
jgi:hypothetical protein